MFNAMLVLLDGSISAEAVLPYVEVFARRLGSNIHFLHVCSPECGIGAVEHKKYLDSKASDLKQKLMTASPVAASVSVTATIEEGRPDETIASFIVKNAIDLIALTNYGTSNHEIGVLGRVADRITRTARVPTLLVKPGITAPSTVLASTIDRILLPLDGSDLSKLALPYAEFLAARFLLPITLFQMSREIYPYYGEAAPYVDYQKLTDDEKVSVQAELTSLQAKLTSKGLKVDQSTTTGNDAAYEIIEMSKKIAGCLMVMSTHGRSGISRWAFGSVADKVLRYSESPLLLVPARTT